MTGPTDVMNPGGLSAEAEARKRRTGSDMPLPNLDDPSEVSQWRFEQHQRWGEDVAPGEVIHRPVVVAGVPCLMAGPVTTRPVVYLHGGGFWLGSPGTAIPITARLARSHRVVSVDYRLSPEHRCPAAIEDVMAVCAELSGDGPFVLAGDSAGGNLAVSAALEMAEQGHVGPEALALLCPHLDFRHHAGDFMQQSSMAAAYLGDRQRDDPLASPLVRADESLRTLPPMLVQTTDSEVMHDQAVELAHRVPDRVTLQIWHDLWHAWHYHRELPEAWDAVDRAAEWLAPMGHRGTGTV